MTCRECPWYHTAHCRETFPDRKECHTRKAFRVVRDHCRDIHTELLALKVCVSACRTELAEAMAETQARKTELIECGEGLTEARQENESLKSELALVKARETRFREATNECCTCGGGSPDDGCPACKVWHLMEGS